MVQKPKSTNSISKEYSEELDNIRKKGELDIETYNLLQSINSKPDDLSTTKHALLEKIKAKNRERYNSTQRNANVKKSLSLPVSRSSLSSRKSGSEDMLKKLRRTALKQGAEEMAKLFGYKSHQEQKEALAKLEKRQRLMAETLLKEEEGRELSKDSTEDDPLDEEMLLDEEEKKKRSEDLYRQDDQSNDEFEKSSQTLVLDTDQLSNEDSILAETKKLGKENCDPSINRLEEIEEHQHIEDDEPSEEVQSDDERNESTIEEDKESVSDEDVHSENQEKESKLNDSLATQEHEKGSKAEKKSTDRASVFRAILEQDQKKLRKKKKGGSGYIEQEAEEEEEENVLAVNGLGNFGFGVPQINKEAEDDDDEKIAPLQEDDLQGIVDELSDGETSAIDDEYFAENELIQDSKEIKQVMKNVREGFGRNRRVFSGGEAARGKFNLDDLLAADGSKEEAARLGLLESDEELSDHDEDKEKEDEDDEARMERELRERFLQQKEDDEFYLTSSDEEEIEDEVLDPSSTLPELDSDEEREKKQMQEFSRQAKINRRLLRLSKLEDKSSSNAFENDPEAQELIQSIKCTNLPRYKRQSSVVVNQRKEKHSLILSRISSFTQAAISMTSISSTSSKGYVFTSSTVAQATNVLDKENLTDINEEPVKSSRSLKRPRSPSTRTDNFKKHKKNSHLLDALLNHQCKSTL